MAFKDSADRLVADVDCTADGKSLCDSMGVEGYPTIKYGDPHNLQDYKEGRGFADLKKFFAGLGPECGPAHPELCDVQDKLEIQEFQAMSVSELEQALAEKEKKLETLEADFKVFMQGLEDSYKAANAKKEEEVEELRSNGLSLLKGVHRHATKKANA